MTQDAFDIMQWLLECSNCIDNDEFNEAELALLKTLEQLGLVALSWRVTERGKIAFRSKIEADNANH